MTKATFTQLAASSPLDVNISTDNEDSLFIHEAHKPTDFSMNPREYILPGAYFGKTVDFSVPLDGDLIRRMYVIVKLPSFSVNNRVPINSKIPPEKPQLITEPTQTIIKEPVLLTPAAQSDWSNILFNELKQFVDQDLSVYFTQLDIIRFITLDIFAIQETSILRKIIFIANESTEIFDENATTLALLGLITLYHKYIIYVLQMIVDLFDSARLRSVTEIVENWQNQITLDWDDYTPSSRILLTLLQDDLLTTLTDVINDTNTRLNIVKLSENHKSVPDYRDFLNEKLLLDGFNPTLLESLYLDTLTKETTEEVTQYYINGGIPFNKIRSLHDDFVGETINVQNAINILTLTAKDLQTTILSIDTITLSQTIGSIIIPSTLTQVSASTIATQFDNLLDTVQNTISRQLFYTFILLSIEQKVSYTETVSPREYIGNILVNEIPNFDRLYNSANSFFTALESILIYCGDVFEKIYPLAKSPLFTFTTATLLFYYSWNDQLFPAWINPGSYYVNDMNTALQQIMVQNNHYMIEDATNELHYFQEIGYSEQNMCLVYNSYPIPISPDDRVGFTFPLGFPFPETISYPQLIVPSPRTYFTEISGFIPGTYGSKTEQSIIFSNPIYWSRLLDYRIYVRILGNSYVDNSLLMRDYLDNFGELPNVSDPYIIQKAFDAFNYPHPGFNKRTPYDDFIEKQAIIGEIFLEEMYYEYTFKLMPVEWYNILEELSASYNLEAYDKQVLWAYHLESINSIELRSLEVASIITNLQAYFLRKSVELGINNYLQSMLSLEQYIEFTRTNEIYFNKIYQEWKDNKSNWSIVQKAVSDSFYTVVEEHHFNRLNDQPSIPVNSGLEADDIDFNSAKVELY